MKYFLLLFGLIYSSCNFGDSKSIESLTSAFYEVYKERKDMKGFLEFYADDVVFEDIVNGDRLVGKQALEKFLNWTHPDFQLLEEDALVVEETFIAENTAIVNGYFTRFKWGESEYEAMHFTTQLTFDMDGKIVRQVDWINYPASLVDYSNRQNSNLWLLENKGK